MSGWRGHVALLALLALLGYGHLLVPGRTLFSPHSDFVAWGMANKLVLYRSFHAGAGIPFWRSDQLAGYAALTNPNSLYTYPLHALFLMLAPAAAVGPVAWLHFLLSGLSFYWLAVVLRLGTAARLLMAVAGLFSFKLILATYAGFLFMPSAALLAALLAAFIRTFEAPDLKALLLFSAVAYLCLNGHPQIFFYALGAMGVWSVVWCAGSVARGQARQAARSLLTLSVGGLLALGLMAHVLLPLAEETPLVTRAHRNYESYLAQHSVGVGHLSTLLFPEALGTPLDHSYPTDELWEDDMYFGLVPLLLALAGAWLCRRRPIAIGFAASLAVVLLLACDSPLLRFLFEHVPGVRFLRHPGRILFLAPVFGIALAGLGLQELLDRLRTPSAIRTARVAVSLALAAICLEGAFYARRYVTTLPTAEAFPVPPYARVLASDTSRFRVAPTSRSALNYGWAAPLGLELITGYDHINYRHFQVYMDVLRQGSAGPARAVGWYDLQQVTRWDLLDALNVKYLVSETPLAAPPNQLREVGHWAEVSSFFFFYGLLQRPAFLYQNLQAKPRAYFVDSVTHTAPDSEITELARTDITHVALLSEPSGGATISTPEAHGSAQVENLHGRDGHLELVTHSSARRFLVLSEVWHPGWSATIDAVPLPLHRANVALMGVWIPQGRHHVKLTFEPTSWQLGLGITSVAAALFLLVLLFYVRQR